MKITVTPFTFNGFQENTYILHSIDGTAVIIDAGCYTREEELTLTKFIESNDLNVVALLSTHAHIDHVLGNHFVLNQYKVPYYLHPKDHDTLNQVANYAHVYGFTGYKSSPNPTHQLVDGEILEFGEIRLQVFYTPGHCVGHVVFYNNENNFVINGDVLFAGSFGRVDLPGGNLDQLKNSIFNVMFKFPDETTVYCGHGPSTTIGQEKKTNYILNF